MIMYNDYICHGDHKYLARVKTAANKYRYFYTQAAYNAYKNAKTIGTGLLAASKLSYNRKKLGKLATTNRRTDIFAEWDEARRKEYETNAVNPAGPGAGQQALNNWNQMITDFGTALWKKHGNLLVQPTVSTEEAYDNYYGRPKSSYRIRPKSREKKVTGNAVANWTKRKTRRK